MSRNFYQYSAMISQFGVTIELNKMLNSPLIQFLSRRLRGVVVQSAETGWFSTIRSGNAVALLCDGGKLLIVLLGEKQDVFRRNEPLQTATNNSLQIPH